MSLTDVVGKKPKEAAPKPPKKTNGTGNGSNYFERARKWVAKADPAISGSGGHNATWAVARKCAADFGLDYQQTLDILYEYNERCQPPWSPKELEHKARQATEKARVSVPVEDRERHWSMPVEHYQSQDNGAVDDTYWADGSPVDPKGDYQQQQAASGGPKEDHAKQQAAKKRRLSVEDIVGEWREQGAMEHVDIGIATLDAACRGGMAIPRRVLLVGAPSSGKTFLEIWIAERFLTVLRDYGFIVGIVAVDEYTGDVLARLAQMNGFKRDEIEARQSTTLEAIETKLSNASLGFYDSDWTLDEIIADLAEWSKNTGKKAVLFVDSMHTARCEGSDNARSPKEHVEMNLRILKAANLQHKFTIIATAEMNRFGYSSEENAEKANKMALAAEARAFEYWAELMIVLQSMKDFPGVTHCTVAKNRGGSKDVHFWLKLDHEGHDFTECGDPNTDPALVAEVEQSKRAATGAKNLRDAEQLGKFMVSRQGINKRNLRIEVKAANEISLSKERIDVALATLRKGLTTYALREDSKGEGKETLHYVTVRDARADD